MVIERPHLVKEINETQKWVLIYGRRKTGKTFLVEHFIKHHSYFFVKKDKSIISKTDEKEISYETFIELLKRDLQESRTVVVDEFHRLGNEFFDFLHYTKKQGKLILISSTLFLSKKLLSSNSPLLGFFAEIQVPIIRLSDCISELKKIKISKKELVEYSILLREPLTFEYFNKDINARDAFCQVLRKSMKTIPALIGEIFVEEERSISQVYEGVLRAIAGGKALSSEISTYLFSRRLIKKDDPSLIQQYLDNLIKFGIIKRTSLYNKNKYIYKHNSPLTKLFYYADEKYNISEKDLTEKETKEIIDNVFPHLVEDNIREFLAEKLGLTETILEEKDYDIDVCLLKLKKPEIAIEIKWKNDIDSDDLRKAEKNLKRIRAKTQYLFVPDKTKVKPTSLKVVDITDFT